MKKIILSVAIVLIASMPFITRAAFDQNLAYGMSNQNVTELQTFLVKQGCLQTQPTGYFGPMTRNGVKCFQAEWGIMMTGYFGPLTRAKAQYANQVSDAAVAPIVENTALSVSAVTTTAQMEPTNSSTSVWNGTYYTVPPSQITVQSSSKPMKQKITIAGTIPSLTISDLPNGASLESLSFDFTSSDFSVEQLEAITNSFVVSKGQSGSRLNLKTWNQYDIHFDNLPVAAGKIKLHLTAADFAGSELIDVDPIDIADAYIIEIHKSAQTGIVGYTVAPAWQVEGQDNPNQ